MTKYCPISNGTWSVPADQCEGPGLPRCAVRPVRDASLSVDGARRRRVWCRRPGPARPRPRGGGQSLASGGAASAGCVGPGRQRSLAGAELPPRTRTSTTISPTTSTATAAPPYQNIGRREEPGRWRGVGADTGTGVEASASMMLTWPAANGSFGVLIASEATARLRVARRPNVQSTVDPGWCHRMADREVVNRPVWGCRRPARPARRRRAGRPAAPCCCRARSGTRR